MNLNPKPHWVGPFSGCRTANVGMEIMASSVDEAGAKAWALHVEYSHADWPQTGEVGYYIENGELESDGTPLVWEYFFEWASVYLFNLYGITEPSRSFLPTPHKITKTMDLAQWLPEHTISL